MHLLKYFGRRENMISPAECQKVIEAFLAFAEVKNITLGGDEYRCWGIK